MKIYYKKKFWAGVGALLLGWPCRAPACSWAGSGST